MTTVDREAPVHLYRLPAPGEDRYVSLALANTRFPLGGREVELLDGTDAARLWLVRRGLLPDRVELDADRLRRLRELRGALQDLFAAYTGPGAPPRDSLGTLNSALAAAPSTPRLAWGPQGPHRVADPDTSDPAAALFSLLAEDAVDLLTGEPEQLTRCAAGKCERWFLRSHGARRWCSTTCGNRVRAARAYAARKERGA
ncbi:CGNR zinc finger domain-containing protein [Streptomyces sp. 4F14]|uniref:CGNR zinc finger domain-containing protein n=1 Tax=Streptomyces sp. 4F14 TaxID=3394380 RepID=UPI003A8C37C2